MTRPRRHASVRAANDVLALPAAPHGLRDRVAFGVENDLVLAHQIIGGIGHLELDVVVPLLPLLAIAALHGLTQCSVSFP